MNDLVALPLAHPLIPEQAQMLGLEPKAYRPDDVINVPPVQAMMVINAGLAQVDPADQQAVAAAMAVKVPAPDPGGNTPAGQASSSPAATPEAAAGASAKPAGS